MPLNNILQNFLHFQHLTTLESQKVRKIKVRNSESQKISGATCISLQTTFAGDKNRGKSGAVQEGGEKGEKWERKVSHYAHLLPGDKGFFLQK